MLSSSIARLIEKQFGYLQAKFSERLALSIENDYLSDCFKVIITCPKHSCAYTFSLSGSLTEFTARGQLYTELANAHRYFSQTIKTGGMYSYEFSLTYEQEMELQAKLEQVRTEYIKSCRKQAERKQVPKEELEQYDKVSGYGEF